jgi:hypothetical protein
MLSQFGTLDAALPYIYAIQSPDFSAAINRRS